MLAYDSPVESTDRSCGSGVLRPCRQRLSCRHADFCGSPHRLRTTAPCAFLPVVAGTRTTAVSAPLTFTLSILLRAVTKGWFGEAAMRRRAARRTAGLGRDYALAVRRGNHLRQFGARPRDGRSAGLRCGFPECPVYRSRLASWRSVRETRAHLVVDWTTWMGTHA